MSMIVLFVLFILFLIVLEVIFMFRTKMWVPFRSHPSWLFLGVCASLSLALFLSFEETGFSPPLRAVVFGIDSRMGEQTILEAKEVIKRVTQEMSCSMGLVNGRGSWLCPLSEDRVFFLLELEGIVSEPAAQSIFPSSLQFVQDETEYIIFSPTPNVGLPSSQSMIFSPSQNTGGWLLKKENKEISFQSSDVIRHIENNISSHRQAWTGSETIKDNEKYILLLLVIFGLLWRYRVLVPALGCLCLIHSSSLFGDIPPLYQGSYLASSLSGSNEQAQAERYLTQQFLTDVSEKNRSIYAYNLALLSARSGQYEKSFFWLSQIDSDVAHTQSVQVLMGDVLSSLILTGKGDDSKKKMLEDIAPSIPATPWIQAALVYKKEVQEGAPGWDSLMQQVTSPQLFLLPKEWKENLFQSFAVFQQTNHSPEFNTMFRQRLIGPLSVLLDLSRYTNVWDKIDRLMILGFREARLFELLGVFPEEGKAYSEWMFQQVKSLLQQLPKQDFSGAWDIPGSLRDKWERLQYLSCVCRDQGPSVWKKALYFLPFLSTDQEKRNALLFLFQRLNLSMPSKSSDIQSILNFFINTWAANDPHDFLSTFATKQDLKECEESFSTEYPQSLLFFFKKGIDLILQQQNLRSVVTDAKNCVYVMGISRSQFPTLTAAVQENNRLAQGVYMALQDQTKTDQEKRVVSELVAQDATDESDDDVFEKTYDILRRLEFLLEQEDQSSPPQEDQVSQQEAVSVDKENAVQLLLELEHDEQNVLKDVK